MTKDEFKFQFKRLCDGVKHEATPEQLDAWWSRLQHVRPDDWREAVTSLLLAGRFPYPDKVNDAIDQAVAARKAQEQRQERDQAERFFQGKVSPSGMSETERAYNRFRMTLLLAAFLPDRPNRCQLASWREAHPEEACPDCLIRQQQFAQVHVDGLAAWIGDEGNAIWASMTPQGNCQFHAYAHTLHRCIADELHYWTARAAGASDRAAREAILGVMT